MYFYLSSSPQFSAPKNQFLILKSNAQKSKNIEVAMTRVCRFLTPEAL